MPDERTYFIAVTSDFIGRIAREYAALADTQEESHIRGDAP